MATLIVLNNAGVRFVGDITLITAAAGVVVTDSSDGHTYRISTTGGIIGSEQVS